MRKAKIRSMQRGAQKRDRDLPLNLQELYKKHPPKISKADKPHLDFIRFGKIDKFERIKTVIFAAQKNRIGSASQISSLLNKLSITTAIGEKWTPRLAWFVKSAIREERSTEANPKRPTNRPHKDAKFHFQVNWASKIRLDEMRDKSKKSKLTLGDVCPELVDLKRNLENK